MTERAEGSVREEREVQSPNNPEVSAATLLPLENAARFSDVQPRKTSVPSSSTAAGMTISESDAQSLNVPDARKVSGVSCVKPTVRRDEQPEKAPSPSDVRRLPSNDAIAVSRNARLPTVSTVLPRSSVVRLIQPSNALVPTVPS